MQNDCFIIILNKPNSHNIHSFKKYKFLRTYVKKSPYFMYRLSYTLVSNCLTNLSQIPSPLTETTNNFKVLINATSDGRHIDVAQSTSYSPYSYINSPLWQEAIKWTARTVADDWLLAFLYVFKPYVDDSRIFDYTILMHMDLLIHIYMLFLFGKYINHNCFKMKSTGLKAYIDWSII